MRLRLLTAALFAATLAAQGHVSVDQSTVNLGKVDAAKGTIAFEFTVLNSGDKTLRLQWLDLGNSAVIADIDNGLLPPGESTKVRGSFDPRHLVGPFTTHIDLHAEDIQSPITPLELKATVMPDVVWTTKDTVVASGITWHTPRTVAPFILHTRSEDPILEDTVKVITQPHSAITCQTVCSKNTLTITPTISESALPLTRSGQEKLTIQVDNTEYVASVNWERANGILVNRSEDGCFTITSPEGRPFKLGKITSNPKVSFRTKKDGAGYLVTPIQPRKKPIHIFTVNVATNHPLAPKASWTSIPTASVE